MGTQHILSRFRTVRRGLSLYKLKRNRATIPSCSSSFSPLFLSLSLSLRYFSFSFFPVSSFFFFFSAMEVESRQERGFADKSAERERKREREREGEGKRERERERSCGRKKRIEIAQDFRTEMEVRYRKPRFSSSRIFSRAMVHEIMFPRNDG